MDFYSHEGDVDDAEDLIMLDLMECQRVRRAT